MLKKVCLLTVGMMALSGCSLFEPWDEEKEAVVQEEVPLDALSSAVYKVEKPYKINDVWYFPAENYQYSQQGLASWYMPANGTATTANGEQYIPSAVSARHKTLPLPSIVRITNLENGKSVIARVNDRGPMVNNRLIDVSQKGAELLEFPQTGTVQVKVEVLPAESQAVKDELVNAGRVWGGENGMNQSDLSLVPPMPVPQTRTQEVVYQRPVQQQTVAVQQPAQRRVAAAGNGIYVRLGAFGNATNAAKAERAANSVAGAATESTMRNGQTLTIVKAGPFASRSEANAAVTKLRRMGYRDAYVAK